MKTKPASASISIGTSTSLTFQLSPHPWMLISSCQGEFPGQGLSVAKSCLGWLKSLWYMCPQQFSVMHQAPIHQGEIQVHVEWRSNFPTFAWCSHYFVYKSPSAEWAGAFHMVTPLWACWFLIAPWGQENVYRANILYSRLRRKLAVSEIINSPPFGLHHSLAPPSLSRLR
jgi:hypothetical protein